MKNWTVFHCMHNNIQQNTCPDIQACVTIPSPTAMYESVVYVYMQTMSSGNHSSDIKQGKNSYARVTHQVPAAYNNPVPNALQFATCHRSTVSKNSNDTEHSKTHYSK